MKEEYQMEEMNEEDAEIIQQQMDRDSEEEYEALTKDTIDKIDFSKWKTNHLIEFLNFLRKHYCHIFITAYNSFDKWRKK